MRFALKLLLIVGVVAAVADQPVSKAHYLANAGVMIERGDTKIVFDPLFRNSYGQYDLVPAAMEQALFAGTPPWDGIDAVFVSHYHSDHFSPDLMLDFLKARPDIHLYAPAQAVAGLRKIATSADDSVFDRVTPIDLEYKDAPQTLEMEGLLIEAVRIPHEGWPSAQLDVQNIAFRITLDETITILHVGDADTHEVHYAHDADHWDKRHSHIAFTPFWFFLAEEGREILDEHLKPGHVVGVHVPERIPSDPVDRPPELKNYDLFTIPGETRNISIAD